MLSDFEEPEQVIAPGTSCAKKKAIMAAFCADDRATAVTSLLMENVTLYADQPEAQYLVARNAEQIMDRSKHDIPRHLPKTSWKPKRAATRDDYAQSGISSRENLIPNKMSWKPNLVPALQELVRVGTLTPETLNPKLGEVIATYRHRYPNEFIPASLKPIFAAAPKTPATTNFVERATIVPHAYSHMKR